MSTTSAQISIYPLGEPDLSPAINEAIRILREHGLRAHPGPMSTLVVGDGNDVLDSLKDVYLQLAGKHGVVVVATLSNACPAS